MTAEVKTGSEQQDLQLARTPKGVTLSLKAFLAYTLLLVGLSALLSSDWLRTRVLGRSAAVASSAPVGVSTAAVASTGGASGSPASLPPVQAPVEPRGAAPWGELIKTDIEVELPDEYAALDLNTVDTPKWRVAGKTREELSAALGQTGLNSVQVATLLRTATAESLPGGATGWVLTPDAGLITGLTAEVRARLYPSLAGWGANPYMTRPYVLGRGDAAHWLKQTRLPAETLALIRSLVYRRGDLECFSDLEYVFGQLTSKADRLRLLKAVSRRPAVLAALRIAPGADIDKLLGYWGHGIKSLDIRPVLESVAAQPDGGSISLLHLLPRFAREHLFTFPTPPSEMAPAADCHWTTLNFFNDTIDNSILTNGVSWGYINERFYRVGEATQYGDVLLFVSERGRVIHSARFIADDLLFTKNGSDFSQPWTLMRLADVAGLYRLEGADRILIYRAKGG